jgi:hypothetical protein
MKFKKIILKPGTYISPDGEINIDKNRISRWVSKFNEMKSSGLNIPTPWGHQSKARPISEDENEFRTSKYNAGFVETLGQDEQGRMYTVIDVPRAEDADRIGTIVKEVSPQIESVWRDGSGKTWSDVITHLALVTHPVVAGQENFEPVKDDPLPSYSMRLSLSNYKEDKDMPEPIDMDATPTKKTATPSQRATPNKAASEVSTSGSMDPELLDLLASVGLVLPEDLELPANSPFVEALKAAALTLKHKIDELEGPEAGAPGDLELPPELMESLNKAPATEQDNTQMQEKKPLEEQPAQMTMSLTKELNSAKQRLSLTERKLEESEKKQMIADVKQLLSSGRITPPIATKLQEEIRVYKMSLNTNTGEALPSPVLEKIEMFKMIPENSTMAPADRQRMSLTEEILPDTFKEMGEDEASRIADQQLRASGRSVVLN